jgi:hypothetical protein
MLTYPVCTSMALPAKDGLIFCFVRKWLNENPEKAKKTDGDLLDLVV